MAIQNEIAYPNPYNLNGDFSVGFDISRPADKITVRIYSASYRKVLETSESGYFFGETAVTVRQWRLGKMGNGIYYVQVIAEGAGERAFSKPVEAIILR